MVVVILNSNWHHVAYVLLLVVLGVIYSCWLWLSDHKNSSSQKRMQVIVTHLYVPVTS